MVKLTALYKKPGDIEEFDRYYKDVHTPLAQKMPGLKKIELGRVVGAPGGDSDYHLVANLYFDNLDSLKSAMSSEEGKAAAKDLNNFARGLVQMMICEVKSN
jgi:uncharacterized protein (TIGR02118 family)